VLRGRPLEALAITRSAAGKGAGRTIVDFTVSSPGLSDAQKAKP